MTTNNDEKIKELLEVIELKKKNLGEKPKALWKTNGLLKIETDVNINTITTIHKCIDSAASILATKHFKTEAAKLLDVPSQDLLWNGYSFEDWIHDIKLRASMITWDSDKKKLISLESKLSDLRSQDAKTADAISSILKELN